MVTIELFGVPRLKARTVRVEVEAATLADALHGLGRACPALLGAFDAGGRIHPAYRLSLNGDRFVTEPDTPLTEGDVLLLLSADVGG